MSLLLKGKQERLAVESVMVFGKALFTLRKSIYELMNMFIRLFLFYRDDKQLFLIINVSLRCITLKVAVF